MAHWRSTPRHGDNLLANVMIVLAVAGFIGAGVIWVFMGIPR